MNYSGLNQEFRNLKNALNAFKHRATFIKSRNPTVEYRLVAMGLESNLWLTTMDDNHFKMVSDKTRVGYLVSRSRNYRSLIITGYLNGNVVMVVEGNPSECVEYIVGFENETSAKLMGIFEDIIGLKDLSNTQVEHIKQLANLLHTQPRNNLERK